MARAWAVAIFFVPFMPAASFRDVAAKNLENPVVMPDTESSCPEVYKPTKFNCFGLPNSRTICGMARPTTDENCMCGVYKAFYKRRRWFFPDPAEDMCTVLATCYQRTFDARDDAEVKACEDCRKTNFKQCYKHAVLSQAGAVLSILQRAEEHLNVARKRAGVPTHTDAAGTSKRQVTLISLDDKEIGVIMISAGALDMEHNSDFVIEDFTSPTKEQLSGFVDYVLHDQRVLIGDVIVHCGGGMGRTGVFLIALKTKLLLEEERKRLHIPLAQLLDKTTSSVPKPRYRDVLGPITEATDYVQTSYHPDAGEFLEVKTNLNVLLELVKLWSGSWLVSEVSVPAKEAFFMAYKGRCLKIKSTYQIHPECAR